MAYPKMSSEGNYWNVEVIIIALYADFLWIINIRCKIRIEYLLVDYCLWSLLYVLYLQTEIDHVGEYNQVYFYGNCTTKVAIYKALLDHQFVKNIGPVLFDIFKRYWFIGHGYEMGVPSKSICFLA